jgi:hypothetical protein
MEKSILEQFLKDGLVLKRIVHYFYIMLGIQDTKISWQDMKFEFIKLE